MPRAFAQYADNHTTNRLRIEGGTKLAAIWIEESLYVSVDIDQCRRQHHHFRIVGSDKTGGITRMSKPDEKLRVPKHTPCRDLMLLAFAPPWVKGEKMRFGVFCLKCLTWFPIDDPSIGVGEVSVLQLRRQVTANLNEPRSAQADPELYDWLLNAANFAGDFLKSIAWAGLRADADNYPVLRPALLVMKFKYPEYAQHYTARLIAAAPELLQTLKAIHSVTDSEWIKQQCDDAIQKAEGGQ
jgi:hypothetical protein